MPDLIRKGEAAELLGVSAPRISQLLRASHLSEVAGTGMLSREEVEEIAHSRDGNTTVQGHQQPPLRAAAPLQRRPAQPVSSAPLTLCSEGLPSITVSRQRLEALRAEIAQHALDARNGKFVLRADVARAEFQEGQRIRQGLEGLPFRLGNILAAVLGLDGVQASYIVQDVMAGEIRQLLMTLAADPEKPSS
jgi:hypothetical protein